MKRFVELTDDLLTGVAERDEQHRVLVSLLNEAYQLLAGNRRAEAVEKLTNGIASYVDVHFQCEEAYQQQINFPECEVHKKIHDAFRQQARAWVAEAQAGDAQALREILALIWAWLFRHICGERQGLWLFCESVGKRRYVPAF